MGATTSMKVWVVAGISKGSVLGPFDDSDGVCTMGPHLVLVGNRGLTRTRGQ